MWRAEMEEGNETGKVHDRIAPYVYGHGVDLGCGCWKLKVEKTKDYSCLGVDGGYSPMALKEADVIADVTDLPMFTDGAFDYVFSSHTLEDMHYPQAVLREWWRILKPGGNLILYLPLTRNAAKELGREDWQGFYPNIGELGANINHQKDFTPQQIKDMVAYLGPHEVLADEIRGEKDEYSFLQVYRKGATVAAGSTIRWKELPRNGQKRALVVRYGAIGDCIQSVPVLRKLKEEGYHVTVNCAEPGRDVFLHSPYVDEVCLQIRAFVPNEGVVSGALVDYWKDYSASFDKFVNLTGAAEESLLIPDSRLMAIMEEMRGKHPELNEESIFYNAIRAVRKAVGDTNYYDNHLAKAGYEDTGMNGELFFSQSENEMGQGFRDRYKGRFIVMWVLSGSSYHKRYPYFQEAAQQLIIKNPDVLLISVGDPECALIERSESNKYLPRSGRWKLRTTLSMCRYVDLVVGPETGILNAAGCFDTPKITFLSHSSHNNLCKYWVNDFCIAPNQAEVFCHPCHTLHYVHDAAGGKCTACSGTHTVMGDIPTDKKFAGIWTCPYEVTPGTRDNEGKGVLAPLCTTRLTSTMVLNRINEVYTLWKQGAFKEKAICQLA